MKKQQEEKNQTFNRKFFCMVNFISLLLRSCLKLLRWTSANTIYNVSFFLFFVLFTVVFIDWTNKYTWNGREAKMVDTLSAKYSSWTKVSLTITIFCITMQKLKWEKELLIRKLTRPLES